jgi:hypothetical protein
MNLCPIRYCGMPPGPDGCTYCGAPPSGPSPLALAPEKASVVCGVCNEPWDALHRCAGMSPLPAPPVDFIDVVRALVREEIDAAFPRCPTCLARGCHAPECPERNP